MTMGGIALALVIGFWISVVLFFPFLYLVCKIILWFAERSYSKKVLSEANTKLEDKNPVDKADQH